MDFSNDFVAAASAPDSLFAQAPVSMAVLRGAELIFELVNPAFLAAVRGRQVLGRSLREALPETRQAGVDALLQSMLGGGKTSASHEVRFELEDAGRREEAFFTFTYSRLQEPDGAARRVMAVCHEITEQVRARERAQGEREQMEGALRDNERRKDEFLATLSHELRNPLAPLRNSVELLRLTGGDEAPSPTILDVMDRQVNHLVRLVDDLLEMSRISRGTLRLRKEQVALAAFIATAVETSVPLIKSAGHDLTVELPDTPLWVDGDPVRLAQILSNLLNNAAKYTEPGGKISLEAKPLGACVEISVRDNGLGLVPDAVPRLFEMFSRGAHTRAHHQGGLGIGLALARRLAEMHGGSIEARSPGLGKGSEFTVRLPLLREVARQAPLNRTNPGDATMLDRRILVVDDNVDAAESLGMLLDMLGAKVCVAHSGPEALEAFRRHEAAVVLLDIGMPGMDGYEVAQRLRADFPEQETTIVALTGWGQEEDRRRAQAAGFDHHLIKPADLGALRKLLASLDGPQSA